MTLTELAKSAVETFISKGKIIAPPEDLPDEFKRKAGVFVTIEKGKELRGCIGTYLSTQNNLALEIINNAVAAATEDYRFNPITKEELSYLAYTVYILNPPEPISDLKELDPKKYGIIVQSNIGYRKSGLLLPDLEGIDATEQQLAIACQKAGINPEKEEITVYRFTAEKYQ